MLNSKGQLIFFIEYNLESEKIHVFYNLNKFQSESDYDILVLVTKKTKELRDKIDEIVWEIAWEYNVVITAFIYEKSRFENDRFEPLFMNIQKEGVLIQ